jgi:hypothetical protein
MLTVPLPRVSAGEVVTALGDAGIATSAISSRQPTLDDVYLQQTGGRLAEAA